MSENKKRVYPSWDDKPNAELPKRSWSVCRWAQGDSRGEIKPQLYELGVVQGSDHSEARGAANQQFGSQMFDYLSPINPSGEAVGPPPKKPDPGVKWGKQNETP